jgi:hypothetical protein
MKSSGVVPVGGLDAPSEAQRYHGPPTGGQSAARALGLAAGLLPGARRTHAGSTALSGGPRAAAVPQPARRLPQKPCGRATAAIRAEL